MTYYDPSRDTIDLDRLRTDANASKPGGHDETVAELVALYEDGPAARGLLRSYLVQLGLGLQDQTRPLQVGLLRYLVERLATRYDAPATRQLRDGRQTMPEDGPDHEAMTRLVEAVGVDSAMRVADRLAVLTGSAFLRPYWTDEAGLTLRVFSADLVARVPHPAVGDLVQHDAAVVLTLARGMYEVHWVTRGQRYMAWTDDKGSIREDSPLAGAGHRLPYARLPLVRLDDQPLVGRPWSVPPASRVSYALALGGMQSDIQAMTALQAHSTLVYMTSDPMRDAPAVTGPGQVVKIDQQDTLQFEQAQPLIAQVESVMVRLITTFLLGEQVPMHEVDGKTVLTGAALKVAERGLAAKRQAGLPLAVRAERELWEAMRAVHNAHCERGEELNEGSALVVEHANTETPQDELTLLQAVTQEMAIGVSSLVDATQRVYRVGRDEAVQRLERVRADQGIWGKAEDPADNLGAVEVVTGQAADSMTQAVSGLKSGLASEEVPS